MQEQLLNMEKPPPAQEVFKLQALGDWETVPRDCHNELAPFCVPFLRYRSLATARDRRTQSFDLTHYTSSNAVVLYIRSRLVQEYYLFYKCY